MKALLVQCPATSPWVPRRQWEPPSVALATIAAQIDNHDVKVLDLCPVRKRAVPLLMETLRNERPDVVGFSGMAFQYDCNLRLAYLAKTLDPRVRTVLGGYHATLSYDEIDGSPGAEYWDFMIRGEGDFSFGELLDSLDAQGRGMDKVLGLSYRTEGRQFQHNAPRPLEDVTKIRMPARDKRLINDFHMYFRRADVIETSRGCLFQCNFCSIHQMYGSTIRQFPLERVMADIEDAYSRGARHIFCTDDNITQSMDRFEQLIDAIISLKLKNLRFTTQATVAGFSQRPHVIKKLGQAGFIHVFLGIENASTKNLRAMKKPNTLPAIKKAVAELQKEKIIVIAGLINGLPTDDPESMRENYRFIKEQGVTSVMDQIMTPYPKTPLRDEMVRAGLVRNFSDVRWYDGYFSNVRTSTMSPEELSFARWKIRREIIGMWRPTKGDWKYFKGYSYLWMFGLRYIIWINERMLELLFGIEGRYKLQLRHFLQLNNFKIDVPGLERKETYHPIYGTSDDPFLDTRWSLLKKRLKFSWRKLLAIGSAKETKVAEAAPERPPARTEQPVFQPASGKAMVAIAPQKGP
ncbi:MAG TPA: radical SAM protein [Candidatus Sulfotelmatobacter sp.]|nr:radical SAM protein [Candidatus Sulfotelmatobacter sp.]